MNENEHTSEPISVRLIEDRSRWEKRLPVIACFISIFALAVSFLGAHWARQNYQLSVVPLITVWHAPNPEKPEIYWKVANAGLGPTKIRDIALFVDGKRGERNIAEGAHWQNLESVAKAKLYVNWDKLLVPGEGFRAGDEIQPFLLSWENPETMEQFAVDTVVLAICYCSFYEQCWYTDSRVYSGHPKDELIKHCPK